MSSLIDLEPSLRQSEQIQHASIVDAVDGKSVTVRLSASGQLLDCQVLRTGTPEMLTVGDVVLVWLDATEVRTGVVLGRIGPYSQPSPSVVSPNEFAARPQTLVLEAQGDVILRNGQAKITLGANGDVDIVGASFTTRAHKLLRLLAPLIKLN